jgi:aspartyl protease family protein
VTGDEVPRTVYLVLLLMLVGSSLVARRLPVGQMAKMALAWIAIFGAAFVLIAFRHDFVELGQRLRAEATGTPIESGSELRIPVSEDGHFWVRARINGTNVNFLVDSGASITTVSQATAERAGIETGVRVDMVQTANGQVLMRRGNAEEFQVGPISRPGLSVSVNPGDRTNVLGMNFLSSLRSWRVEGNYLVLVG